MEFIILHLQFILILVNRNLQNEEIPGNKFIKFKITASIFPLHLLHLAEK